MNLSNVYAVRNAPYTLRIMKHEVNDLPEHLRLDIDLLLSRMDFEGKRVVIKRSMAHGDGQRPLEKSIVTVFSAVNLVRAIDVFTEHIFWTYMYMVFDPLKRVINIRLVHVTATTSYFWYFSISLETGELSYGRS